MSLIHGYNGFTQAQNPPQQAHLNGNLLNSHLSLIHQSERFKPYDLKMRSNASSELNAPHHRVSKSHQIVPQPAASKLYSQRQQQHTIRLGNGNGLLRNDNPHRSLKASKLSRHSNDLSIKESLIAPEADKNNNTTLTNCNMTLNAVNHSNGGSSNSSNGQHSPIESNSLLPPIPSSLADSNSDSEANLVPRNFVEGFPAGISKDECLLPLYECFNGLFYCSELT